MTKSRLSSFQWFLLIIILITGFGLRFAYLDREMRFDESVTVYQFASKAIPTIVGDYTWVNNHIFHSLLVHFPYHYLSKAPVFVRLPVFITGVALIPLVFVAGSRFYNRNTGLIASALVAVYPIMLDFSVNARGYTMMTFIMMWMIILAHELHQKDDTGKWLLLGLLSALGFFTVPIMLYPMGGIATWLLVSIWRQNEGEKRVALLKNYFVSMFLGAILTILLYTPALYFNWEALFTSVDYDHMRPLPLQEFISRIDDVFVLMWSLVSWEIPLIVMVGLLMLLATGIAFHRKLSNHLPLWIFFAGWILPVLLIQRVVPFNRTWLFLVPVLLITVSAGFDFALQAFNLKQDSMLATLLIGICVLSGGYILSTNIIWESGNGVTAPDAEEAMFLLNEMMTENDQVILQIPYNYPILYYSILHNIKDDSDEDIVEASDDFIASVIEEAHYIYIIYSTSGNEGYIVDQEGLNDLKARAEVVHEWESSILVRALVSPGDE